MVSPKDRVKANIYKELFEEEKRKNKRKSLFSVSLFFLGIFTSSTYQMLVRETPIESTINYAVNKSVTGVERKKIDLSMEHFFSNNFFDDKKIEINADELFGLDTQI
ncbi:hypothetical protein [uncultured Fusobacterium sp.]|uniref:hypothetical protein n=1 Tax=uncultured Fusobacterium sp. TaxID=159267 RepID=UPI0025F9EC7E|nr:hypothetical protein [uncultured Fusobacterium sp.]